MSLDSSKRPSRTKTTGDVWPKWMWVAVPVLVVVVVAGLWWAIFSETEAPPPPTATPVPNVVPTQPTQAPTEEQTLSAEEPTDTPRILTPLSTATPPPEAVVTPTGPAEVDEGSGELGPEDTAVVADTGGVGLNIRSGAGTSFARIKTLAEGTVVEVVGGPRDADGFTWLQVRDETGTIGWGATRFLKEQ